MKNLNKDTNEIATICRFLKLILTNNIFHFENKYYQQIQGTAMGTKMVPSYAIIFMSKLEDTFLQTQQLKPLIWWRYIDDIFMIWSHGRENLNIFIQNFDQFHPTIKLTWDISDTKTNFLDTTLTLTQGIIKSTLYTKPTDRHLYLFYHSCHPNHNKNSIPYSQALRIRRICSDDKDFDTNCQNLKTYLLARGYKPNLISTSISKAKSINRSALLEPKQPTPNNKSQIIPLVTTYHPSVNVNRIVQAFKTTLLLDPTLNKVFEGSRFLTAYKHPPNLRDILVRAKFCSAPTTSTRTQPGTKVCNQGCKVCKHIDPNPNININNVSHHIYGKFTCTSTDLVYLISCTKCPSFYIGETGRKLSDRIKEHLRDINNKTDKQIPNHFNQFDHSVSHLRVKAITANKSNLPENRRKSERLWIYRLNALSPPGLNIKDW